jgi:chromosome partitioning protein
MAGISKLPATPQGRFMAGQILTIATQKGGAGKTTLARVISTHLAATGHSVAVIDADPNKGLTEWASLYAGPAIAFHAEPDEKRLASLPADLAENHDIVLIDTAGFGSRSMLVAIGAADAVLIPCTPDRGAVREAEQTAEWVRNLSRSTRREIPCRVIMTAFDPRRAADRHARQQARTTMALPLLDSILSDRTAYQAASWTGTIRHDPATSREADQLCAELVEMGWIRQGKSRRAAP